MAVNDVNFDEIAKLVVKRFNPSGVPFPGNSFPHHVFMQEPIVLDYKFEVVDFDYEKFSPTLQPNVLGSSTFINKTSASDSQTFTDSRKTTMSYTLSINKGTQFTIGTEFKAGTPLISGGVSASITVSSSTTHSETKTDDHTWTWATTIPVPAHSRVIASVIIQEAIYSPKFQGKFRITGTIKGKQEFSDISGNPVFIERGIGDAFEFAIFHNLPIDIESINIVDKNTIDIGFSGVFSGVQGIQLTVKTEQFPLDGGELIETNILL